MPGGVYNFQGRVSFIDILDWERKTGQGRFGGPHPASPSLLFWLGTDGFWWKVHSEAGVASARCTLDGRYGHAGWQHHSASPPTPTAGRCLLPRRRSRPSRVAAMAQQWQSITCQGQPRPGTVVGEVNVCGPADHAAVISERCWSPSQPASPPCYATRASLPDTGAWTVAHNCRISQVYTPTKLRSPPSVSC